MPAQGKLITFINDPLVFIKRIKGLPDAFCVEVNFNLITIPALAYDPALVKPLTLIVFGHLTDFAISR